MTVRLASTVLLLREAPADDTGAQVEIFMVRRHGKSRFMPDALVFPGGRLDDADSDADLATACDLTVEEAAITMGRPEGLGLLIAGIRETFEEAGVLLAEDKDGDLIILEGDQGARFAAHRQALNEGTLAFNALVADEGLTLRTSSCRYVTRWITPEVEPRRYDTHFLMARAPAGQRPSHDGHETTAGGWWRPQDTLTAYEAGEIKLAPPTLRILTAISTIPTVDGLLDLRSGVPDPIVPQGHLTEDGLLLLMPGDPDFEGAPVTGRDRFSQKDGRWHSEGERW
ncbi:MAG: NUDIX hydrolase [Bradymonadia bacterium]